MSDRVGIVTLGQGRDVILIHALAAHRASGGMLRKEMAAQHCVHLVKVRGLPGLPRVQTTKAESAPQWPRNFHAISTSRASGRLLSSAVPVALNINLLSVRSLTAQPHFSASGSLRGW